MVCSICKKEGHNKNNKKYHPNNIENYSNKENKNKNNNNNNNNNNNKQNNNKRNESQKHGLIWQDDISKNIYKLTDDELASISYTNGIDIPYHLNHLNNADISIKTSKSPNCIDMGNPLRLYNRLNNNNNTDIKFYMTLINYKQINKNTKKINNIIELDLTNSLNLLFNELSKNKIEELDKYVKTIPSNRRPTKEERKKMYDIRDSFKHLSKFILITIKCDSSQSRIQCSFKCKDFIKEYSNKIISQSNNGNFKDGFITEELKSGYRIRHKK